MYDVYHNLTMDSRSGWISNDQHEKAKLILDKFTPMLLNDVRNRKWSYQGIHSISNDHSMIFSPLKAMFAETDIHLFLGIWDLPEDDILKWMIYGHRLWANKYSEDTINYYIPWALKVPGLTLMDE